MTYNTILGQAVQSSQLQLSFGSYDYNQTTATFQANFPATSGSPQTAVSATVTSNSLPGAFSSILNVQLLPNVTATAQAVHRPRDIALVMDLSGSMRMGTCLGFDFYTNSRTSNNPDSLIPTFGHYSSTSANMQGPTANHTSSDENYTISPSNTTAASSSYALTYVNNFFQNAAYASTLIRAFDSYTSSDGGKTWSANSSGSPLLPPNSYSSVPGGDMPLFKSGSTTTYATTIKDVFNSGGTNILWELDGYSAYSAGKPDTSGTGSVPKVWTQADYSASSSQFKGYTQGPGYYGKTFFLWPPDPRHASITNTTTLQTYFSRSGHFEVIRRTRLPLPPTGAPGWARAQPPASPICKTGWWDTAIRRPVRTSRAPAIALRLTTPFAVSSTGIIRPEPVTARFPRIGGIAFSARPTIPYCSTILAN